MWNQENSLILHNVPTTFTKTELAELLIDVAETPFTLYIHDVKKTEPMAKFTWALAVVQNNSAANHVIKNLRNIPPLNIEVQSLTEWYKNLWSHHSLDAMYGCDYIREASNAIQGIFKNRDHELEVENNIVVVTEAEPKMTLTEKRCAGCNGSATFECQCKAMFCSQQCLSENWSKHIALCTICSQVEVCNNQGPDVPPPQTRRNYKDIAGLWLTYKVPQVPDPPNEPVMRQVEPQARENHNHRDDSQQQLEQFLQPDAISDRDTCRHDQYHLRDVDGVFCGRNHSEDDDPGRTVQSNSDDSDGQQRVDQSEDTTSSHERQVFCQLAWKVARARKEASPVHLVQPFHLASGTDETDHQSCEEESEPSEVTSYSHVTGDVIAANRQPTKSVVNLAYEATRWTLDSIPWELLGEPGHEVNVTITFVLSEDTLVVSKCDQDFPRIIEQLPAYIAKFLASHKEPLDYTPDLSELVLAPFDGAYYRGIIASIAEGLANVSFLEYGNIESIPVKDLYPVSGVIGCIPSVSHNVYVDLAMADEVTKLSSAQIQLMGNMLEVGTTHKAQIKAMKHNKYVLCFPEVTEAIQLLAQN